MGNKNLVFQSTECLSKEEIRLYLKGELNEAARYRAENHLLDCPLCSDAVEGFAGEYNFDEDQELEDLKIVIKKKIVEPTLSSNTNIFTLNRIAAAVIFLVVSSAVLFYWNTQKVENTILAEIQSSNNTMGSVRGISDFEFGELYMEGIELFRNEKYQESLFFFENLLETQPENPTAHYFTGISALNLGELEQAIENLTYARLNDENFYEDATWQLILANLGIGNTTEAKALIDDLLKIEGGFYSSNAEKLKEKLEEK